VSTMTMHSEPMNSPGISSQIPAAQRRVTIGVMALQGDFDAHRETLLKLPDVDVLKVRTPEELARVDALVLPGGESTTMGKLLLRFELMEPLRERLKAGMPAFGTCAGLILLSTDILGRPDQPTIGVLNCTVDRNAFGSQVDSFETNLTFPLPQEPDANVRGVFIRAPYVVEAREPSRVLSRFGDRVVAVQQGSILGIAFHPELTSDVRVHAYFVDMVRNSTEIK
jgi:pyridoxal 5'-phosphate synthase pdxT subunit